MTAEIAILNKTAVALAADSAVTISAGSSQEKIFDSEDKLFELSSTNPIGIMLYNQMQFMEIPLSTIIREFRTKCCPVLKVDESANKFLEHLNELGKSAPEKVKSDHLEGLIRPVIRAIVSKFKNDLDKYIEDKLENKDQADENDWLDIGTVAPEILDKALKKFEDF